MNATECRCPNRPYLGSMARGSQMESLALDRWQSDHGEHAYAKARDELSGALQGAESSVKRGEQNKAGAAVLDMVHDIMGMDRASRALEFKEPPCPDSPACIPGCRQGEASRWHGGAQNAAEDVGAEHGRIAQMLRAPGKMFTRSDVLATLKAFLADWVNRGTDIDRGARLAVNDLIVIFNGLR